MLPSSGRNVWISPTIGGRLNIMNFLRLNSWLLAVFFWLCIVVESFCFVPDFLDGSWATSGSKVMPLVPGIFVARWCKDVMWCAKATYMHEIWMQRATGKDCLDVPVCHRLSRFFFDLGCFEETEVQSNELRFFSL